MDKKTDEIIADHGIIIELFTTMQKGKAWPPYVACLLKFSLLRPSFDGNMLAD